MKKSNVFWKICKFLLSITAIMTCANIIFDLFQGRIKKKDNRSGEYYDWKLGKIFYHKSGSGSPVLLLHDFEPDSSGKDMLSLAAKLSNDHTVYAIDLLGFGFSDKPWVTYTNYIYVQLIEAFIKDIIGEKTDIIAYKGSCLAAAFANKDDPSMIGKVLLCCPPEHEKFSISQSAAVKIKKFLDAPLYGTFAYNMYSLTGAVPFGREGRHVFASRITRHLEIDMTGHEDLLNAEVSTLGLESDTDINVEAIQKLIRA